VVVVISYCFRADKSTLRCPELLFNHLKVNIVIGVKLVQRQEKFLLFLEFLQIFDPAVKELLFNEPEQHIIDDLTSKEHIYAEKRR
jgi:hypothetical protein